MDPIAIALIAFAAVAITLFGRISIEVGRRAPTRGRLRLDVPDRARLEADVQTDTVTPTSVDQAHANDRATSA